MSQAETGPRGSGHDDVSAPASAPGSRVSRVAVLSALGAFFVWGLSPLYFHFLAHVPPLEVLAHRTLWSVATFVCVIAVSGRWRALGALIRDRQAMIWLGFAAVMVATNWFGYIYSIQIGRTTEASLGYYVFPILTAAIGFVFLRERFTRLQGLAFGLACLAVGLLAQGLGVLPWPPLVIATTFALYGLTKRRISAAPMLTVMVETVILAPLALVWIVGIHLDGWHVFGAGDGVAAFGGSVRDTVLLALSGALTAIPLVLFSFATQRLPYSTVGVLFYLTPTLQFLTAVLVLGEAATGAHLVAFPLIWLAVAVYSLDLIRKERQASRSLARAMA